MASLCILTLKLDQPPAYVITFDVFIVTTRWMAIQQDNHFKNQQALLS